MLPARKGSSLTAALDTVPQPAKIGDPNPLTIPAGQPQRQQRDHRCGLPGGKDVHLFVEGPTPDWALPPKLLERTATGLKRFRSSWTACRRARKPEGAALELTLVGEGRAYEFATTLN